MSITSEPVVHTIKCLDPFGDDAETAVHQQLYESLSRYIWIEYVSSDPRHNLRRKDLKVAKSFSVEKFITGAMQVEDCRGYYVVDINAGKWAFIGEKHPLE